MSGISLEGISGAFAERLEAHKDEQKTGYWRNEGRHLINSVFITAYQGVRTSDRVANTIAKIVQFFAFSFAEVFTAGQIKVMHPVWKASAKHLGLSLKDLVLAPYHLVINSVAVVVGIVAPRTAAKMMHYTVKMDYEIDKNHVN